MGTYAKTSFNYTLKYKYESSMNTIPKPLRIK